LDLLFYDSLLCLAFSFFPRGFSLLPKFPEKDSLSCDLPPKKVCYVVRASSALVIANHFFDVCEYPESHPLRLQTRGFSILQSFMPASISCPFFFTLVCASPSSLDSPWNSCAVFFNRAFLVPRAQSPLCSILSLLRNQNLVPSFDLFQKIFDEPSSELVPISLCSCVLICSRQSSFISPR